MVGMIFDESAKVGPAWAQDAAAMLSQNNPEGALHAASRALDAASTTSDRFFALHTMAKAKFQMAFLREALDLAEKACREEAKFEALARHLMAKIYISLFRMDDAAETVNQALSTFRSSRDLIGEASALLTLAKIYMHQRIETEALRALRRSRELFQESKEPSGEFSAIRMLCRLQIQKGKLDEAMDLAETAVALFKDDIDLKGSALILLAEVHSASGAADQVEDLAQRAVELFETAEAWRQQAHCLRKIGEMTFDRGDSVNGWAYVKESLELYRKAQHRRGEAAVLGQISMAHFAAGNFEEGHRIAEEALSISRQHSLQEQVGFLQIMVAEQSFKRLMMLRLKDPSYEGLPLSWQGRVAAKEALEILGQLGSLKGTAQALVILAAAFIEMGHVLDAKEKATEAAEIYRDMGDRAFEGLATSYVAQAMADVNPTEAARLAAVAVRLVQEGKGSKAQVADVQRIHEVLSRRVRPDEFDDSMNQATIGDRPVDAMAKTYEGEIAVFDGIEALTVSPVR